MPLMVWSNSYSVHSSAIDAQHQQLFQMINELYDAMLAGKGNDVLGKILEGLINYARVHFADEEKLMEKVNYPHLVEHQQEHDAFVHKVFEFHTQFKLGNLALSVEVMNFLKDWLTNHILKVDKRYSTYVKG